MFTFLRHPSARIGRRMRLIACALCLVLAAVTALDTGPHARAAPGRTVEVVVTRHALPAGHVLSRADVTTAGWPPSQRPGLAASKIGTVVGRRLAGAMGTGEPITTPRLLGPDLAAGLDAGTVACPLSVDSDVAGLVHAGGRVDVLAAPTPDSPGATAGGTARSVAESVRVLAVLGVGRTDAADESGRTLVIVAVNRTTALRIAGLRTSQMFTVVTDTP